MKDVGFGLQHTIFRQEVIGLSFRRTSSRPVLRAQHAHLFNGKSFDFLFGGYRQDPEEWESWSATQLISKVQREQSWCKCLRHKQFNDEGMLFLLTTILRQLTDKDVII